MVIYAITVPQPERQISATKKICMLTQILKIITYTLGWVPVLLYVVSTLYMFLFFGFPIKTFSSTRCPMGVKSFTEARVSVQAVVARELEAAIRHQPCRT